MTSGARQATEEASNEDVWLPARGSAVRARDAPEPERARAARAHFARWPAARA
ncbi:MAG: hypothetical protein ACHQO8_08690 [Vicinamibacterales bacterium]